jgi:hypothetical protein
MSFSTLPLNRRKALSSLGLAGGALLANIPALSAHSEDADEFAFLIGSWRVRHHRLKRRGAGDDRWDDFEGTCRAWPVLGGGANVDDNLLHAPQGTYRAISVRRKDRTTKLWSIWWLDERAHGFEPPVTGSFKDGVGSFYGDDSHEGKPIRVRFLWSDIGARRARWEQAFSWDQEKHWEVNWVMQFEREA